LALSVQLASILALFPAIGLAASHSLSMTDLPLFNMVANRLSPLEISLPVDRPEPQVVLPAERKEKQVSWLTSLTGARDIEAASAWSMLQADPGSIWVGGGFGGSFQMSGYRRFQADVMPVHLAITSGVPLSLLFTVSLTAGLWRMFLRLGQLAPMDRTLALFVLSLTLDIAVGFNATNPIIWASVGYTLARA
jgi:hypothetical protein